MWALHNKGKVQASVARCLRTPPITRLGVEDLISQC